MNAIDKWLSSKSQASTLEADPVLDFSKAVSHLKDIETFNLTFAGARGFNPYFFIIDTIKPLLERYNKGDRSRELYHKMMALAKIEPRITK